MKSVCVNLGDRSYKIEISRDLLSKMAVDISKMEKGSQAIIISNEIVYGFYGEKIKDSLLDQGFSVYEYVIPDGERYKSWDMAGEILTKMLQDKINRDAFVIALGGGVVGDLAGFIASIYQRGISFYQVPTSLLAQVDSSVGGKVAVNHPLGKNMIGSFYQPKKVYIDLSTLSTLPEREWKSGLSEIIKYGIIWDESFFSYIENNREKIKKRDIETFSYLIQRSCEIKAEVVAIDEKETGIRAYLNLGHTLAHGIEAITEYEYFRHGEAVAEGIKIITELAEEKKHIPKKEKDRIISIFEALDMKYKLPRMPAKVFMDILALDKKNQKGKIVLIIPETIGKVKITQEIEFAEIESFLLDHGYCI